MKKFNYLAILLVSISLSSCYFDSPFPCVRGEGERVTEVFSIANFERVSNNIDANVYITQGAEYHIEVVAQANIIDELEFRISGGELRIKADRCLRSHDDIDIYITMPEVEALTVSGSGGIFTENVLNVSDVDLSISGSGAIRADVEGNSVGSHISGSGDIYLTGEVVDQEIRISGSGKVHAFDLFSERANVRISGSGDADVNVSEYLEVNISGSGNVRYRGTPQLDVKTSGSGKVTSD
ncbi:Putative auto-transporter adhesin, head GIN domain [Catalinimonas alkaloidigena]|uniref:Putative auto-transporter adhesin, head GIN domain n=1 Tax=Catalinimonas alkaloidigena TaxID=1075417 RepID=A0A1G9DPA7_9BACT|nr:head GIN domain-containing protein [Catalinimonas alkaloidigena]SDK65738.1 Putative auto-transporter adhesin, head GIN domain [Catalinimonas alkaloidigena]